MKKIIYIILFISLTNLVMSCTEEEVKPKSELNATGGGASDPVKG
jgi:hypothetical protein